MIRKNPSDSLSFLLSLSTLAFTQYQQQFSTGARKNLLLAVGARKHPPPVTLPPRQMHLLFGWQHCKY